MPSLVSSTSASPPGAPWYENHDPRHKLGWRRHYGPPRLARRPPAPSRCKNQHRRPPLRRRHLSRTTSLRRTYSLRSKGRTQRLDRSRKTHRRSPRPQIRRRPPPPKRLRRRLARLARPNPPAHRLRPRCPQPPAHQSHPCPQTRRNSPARKVLLPRTPPPRRLARSTP